jgi:hypothetical protein
LEVEEGVEEAAGGGVVDQMEEGKEDGFSEGGSEGGIECGFDQGADAIAVDDELGVGEGDFAEGL